MTATLTELFAVAVTACGAGILRPQRPLARGVACPQEGVAGAHAAKRRHRFVMHR